MLIDQRQHAVNRHATLLFCASGHDLFLVQSVFAWCWCVEVYESASGYDLFLVQSAIAWCWCVEGYEGQGQ